MFAEFIPQPIAGHYEEKSFDLETVWKSTDWCWVKFTTDRGEEWVGSFRGTPIKTAIANKTNQVAILTDDCIYILDIDDREIIFFESETQYKDLIAVPTDDKFLVADYYKIWLLEMDFQRSCLPTDYNMDNIQFKDYSGDILNIDWDSVPEYDRVSGYIDTKEFYIF